MCLYIILNWHKYIRKVLVEYKHKGTILKDIWTLTYYIDNNSMNNEYLDLLSENGFVSFINIYTRLPINRKHWYIDHIFIKSYKHLINIVNSGVL